MDDLDLQDEKKLLELAKTHPLACLLIKTDEEKRIRTVWMKIRETYLTNFSTINQDSIDKKKNIFMLSNEMIDDIRKNKLHMLFTSCVGLRSTDYPFIKLIQEKKWKLSGAGETVNYTPDGNLFTRDFDIIYNLKFNGDLFVSFNGGKYPCENEMIIITGGGVLCAYTQISFSGCSFSYKGLYLPELIHDDLGRTGMLYEMSNDRKILTAGGASIYLPES